MLLDDLLGPPTTEPHRPRPATDTDTAEALFGGSAVVVSNLLEREHQLDTPALLTKRVRDYVFRQDQRRRYVAAATRYLKRPRAAARETYDLVLVGAGLHAAAFLYRLRRIGADLHVLVVERSWEVCSTFAQLGDALVLNSPTFSRVGMNANVLPGHFIQVCDFDELAERPFPTAKHLHELATMVLFHADAEIRFGVDVRSITSAADGYNVASRDSNVHARGVVVCNGMGSPRTDAFTVDRRCEHVLFGDDFLARLHQDGAFGESLRNRRVAVVGTGDTANCVMEQLLPLVYPHAEYALCREGPPQPRSVVWVGQSARNIREYFFANKTRYCHAGGLIELFWDGDTPFELSQHAWKQSKDLVRCVPDPLVSLIHEEGSLTLATRSETVEADIVIDCTGRFNALAARLESHDHHFVDGDITFHGGRWDPSREAFTAAPQTVTAQRLACQLTGEEVFLVGSACSLPVLVDDDEARDGSLLYQEDRTSLTNSKWSLEHTLPRTVALADRLAHTLRA